MAKSTEIIVGKYFRRFSMVLGAQRTHDCGRVVDKPYLGITSCLPVMQKQGLFPFEHHRRPTRGCIEVYSVAIAIGWVASTR